MKEKIEFLTKMEALLREYNASFYYCDTQGLSEDDDEFTVGLEFLSPQCIEDFEVFNTKELGADVIKKYLDGISEIQKIKKYKSKPIYIEAIQYKGRENIEKCLEFMGNISLLEDKEAYILDCLFNGLIADTEMGEQKVEVGDYIYRETKDTSKVSYIVQKKEFFEARFGLENIKIEED